MKRSINIAVERILLQLVKNIALKTHHNAMLDAADRPFIEDYVKSCIPFICSNPKILEFDGGVVYAQHVIGERGGQVEFATKRGRLERCNNIKYEVDLNYETIDKQFDLIIATQMLTSFSNPQFIMKQFYKMLKPGGVLIITVSGPAYPKIKGQIIFYSKEGIVNIGREIFGAKNVRNVHSYGNFYSAICMLNYLSNKIFYSLKDDFDYGHEVINGILCVK